MSLENEGTKTEDPGRIRRELEAIRKVTASIYYGEMRNYELPPAEALNDSRTRDSLAAEDQTIAELDAIHNGLDQGGVRLIGRGDWGELAQGPARLTEWGFYSGTWHAGQKYLLPNGSDEQEEERERNAAILKILNDSEHADHERLVAFTGVVLEQAAEAVEAEAPALFEVDPLVCPRCSAEMRVVSVITTPVVIDVILRHLRKTAKDDLWGARAPPAA